MAERLTLCLLAAAGSADAAVLMASEFRAADSDEWSVISDAASLAKSLDGRGRREAGLLRALEAGYDLGATKSGPAAAGVKSGAVSAGQIGAADAAPAKAGAQKAKVTPAEKASQDAAAAKAKPGRKRAAAVLTAKPDNGATGAAQTAAAEPAEDAGNCDDAAAEAKLVKRQRKGAAEKAAGPGKRLTRSQAAA